MKILALAILFPSLALAQGLNSNPPGVGQKRTNYAQNSNGISIAVPWANFSTTAAADAAAPGGGNWASVTTTGTGGLRYQAISGMPTSTMFVSSVYAKKASGTGAAGMRTQGPGAVTACSCYRSDGGTCTASFSGTDCFLAVTDLGTAAVRLVSVFTVTSAGTVGQVAVIPGEWNVAVGTTLFYGMQMEAGVTKASKLCVTTTAARTCR